MPLKPFIVAVAGGSGSGKSTFVQALAERLEHLKPTVISTDHYYRDLSHLAPEERRAVNFDHPNSIECDLLSRHLKALNAGQSIQRPTYDFCTDTRVEATETLEPGRVIFVDGIFALCFAAAHASYGLKVFVDVAEDMRLIRRLRRDMDSRGRSFDVTVQQYIETVKPMHQQFIEPCKWKADLIVPWERHNAEAVNMVSRLIQTAVN